MVWRREANGMGGCSDTKKSTEALLPDVPKWTGVRHSTTFILFLGMANAYIMRTNMSVAIVSMVNQTAIGANSHYSTDCSNSSYSDSDSSSEDGPFVWSTSLQSYILSSFFYGYIITQIPFGLLSKRFGAKYFLGVGMLVNSLFGLLVPLSAYKGVGWLMATRFIQGLGEGPIVPCTHVMLSNWVPPSERSRLAAFVYAGAQLGTVVSLPLSGLLASYGFAGGWPSIFYVFGSIGAVWSIFFLLTIHETPNSHPTITESERSFINTSVWGAHLDESGPIPWRAILRSMPFWAILFAHFGSEYGYDTLLTELPTFMKQVLHYNIKNNGTLSALPYLCMWLFSIFASVMADWLVWHRGLSITTVRKVLNGIGLFGPAVCLVAASYTGCSKIITVSLLCVGVGAIGGTMSGYRINHLDISPRYAGVLMAITNCLANVFALLAPILAGYIVEGRYNQAAWREVFFICAGIYLVAGTIYTVWGSGKKQPWDVPVPQDKKLEHLRV